MTEDQVELAGNIKFSDTVHRHIERYLEAIYKGNLQQAVTAVDAFEDLMAGYIDDEYVDDRNDLDDAWEELQEKERHGKDIEMQYYRTIRKRFRSLIRLAARKGLTPNGSPNPSELNMNT